jgi:orotate phosphoribosyltransferase
METQTDHRERLLKLIRERALIQGTKVKLASGKESDFYLDMKMIELFPEGSHLIGEVMFDLIKNLQIDAIGGLAVGAVPMVTSIVDCCYRHGKELEGFFVRDEVKQHGTRKKIEGNLPDRAKVIVVDDVVTTGGSIDKAIAAVRERGGEIVAVLSIVDRDAGAAEHFASEGIDYRSAFSKPEVLGTRHAHTG